jgi:hypothetical protein
MILMVSTKNTSTGTTKFITVTYLSDGNVEVESNDMTVFDLWALSSYLKMRADEQYITTQTQIRMTEAAKKPQLVTSTQLPRRAGRVQPLHRDD